MSESREAKVYIGNGTVKEAEFFWLKFRFFKEDIAKLVEQSKKSKYGMVAIDIYQRREVSEKGTTHYAVLDTWQPSEKKQDAPAHPDYENQNQDVDDQNLPF